MATLPAEPGLEDLRSRPTVESLSAQLAVLAARNAELEQELADRTAALRHSLEEIKRLTKRLQRENRYLREEIEHPHHDVVGDSPTFQRVRDQVARVAATETTVLLTGETGTGKEVIAHLIHRQSRRRTKAFVRVNCAALTDTLVGSELFGHEKGAFTGADRRRLGRFELATGGTIFLDEIGELSPEVQAKLLRVLQERELERVGGSETIPIDVRVIAATNRDLDAAVAAGRFRSDLLYRLKVFPLRLPPLRERLADILPLAEHFLERASRHIGRRFTGLSISARAALTSYTWPGNIRELANVIERAAILCDGPELDIEPEVLPVGRAGRVAVPASVEVPREPASPTRPTATPEPTALLPAGTLEEVTRARILDALRQTRWKIYGADGAAALLGLKPTTLQAKIKRLGLSRTSSAEVGLSA